MKKLLFIVNNRAGKTRSRSPLYDAIACFSRSGYLVSVHETQGPGDATQTVHDHGAQFDLIVCAGGDGTLNETITGLMTLEERPPLGYRRTEARTTSPRACISRQTSSRPRSSPPTGRPRRSTSASTTTGTLPTSPRSVRSRAHRTPCRRRRKTRWGTSPTSCRA